MVDEEILWLATKPKVAEQKKREAKETPECVGSPPQTLGS